MWGARSGGRGCAAGRCAVLHSSKCSKARRKGETGVCKFEDKVENTNRDDEIGWYLATVCNQFPTKVFIKPLVLQKMKELEKAEGREARRAEGPVLSGWMTLLRSST